ncbi:hypothetical protein K8O93_00685 [Gordonia bronchialis]|uniref:hypothetical protein n=1 Tax=Gordonia bronchialis TaxID=2054 RepID=UPI001CBED981|nr:hypothetical protein [Gordonia bronchialis]UAK38349.1 hypothetical protein K8O93_00685 [Gordonia bronchialis]
MGRPKDARASFAIPGDHVRLNQDSPVAYENGESGLVAKGSRGVVVDQAPGVLAVDVNGLIAWLGRECVDLVIPPCPKGHGFVSDCQSCQETYSARRRAARVRSARSVNVPADLLAELLAAATTTTHRLARALLGIGTIVGLERRQK